jgi:ketosteroid isomerase-like protein
MKPQSESKSIVAVRRLYEARGNPDIVKTVLAPDVRWEVVEGFPHSGIYHGLNGVFDFFTRLFGDFEDWHTEPAEIFEAGDHVIGLGFYFSARASDRQDFQGTLCARLDAARRRHRSSSTVRGHSAAREGIGARPQQMRHEQLRSSHRCDRRQSRHRV